MTAAKTAIAGVAFLLALFAGVLFWVSQRGFSAKDQPSRIETVAARQLRRLATPGDARATADPGPRTPETLREGMSHFADHCASCHANDGSGATEMGANLYPKTPDMRLTDTQSLADGELFYIIENGIRFTGMPAWSTGTPESAQATWHLVQFIRHLPQLTPEEVREMEALNPRTPAELEEEKEDREFLEEPAATTPTPAAKPHEHH